MKLVYGVGINDKKYPSKENSKHTKEYVLWKAILRRCYSKSYHIKYHTYKGCTVSDNFKHYSYFYEWCNTQIGNDKIGWQLDKDILIKGNKIYSENNCVFVPSQINSLFTKANSIRGLYPIGVSLHHGKFKARTRIDNKEIVIGTYDNEMDAFLTYKYHKELYIKRVADRYKDDINPKLYKAMYHYEVEITD